MNLLSFELRYTCVFYIITQMYLTLGRSVYVSLKWLNFEIRISHISTDFLAKFIMLSTPSVTIQEYPWSGYHYSLEVNLFGLTYRKGLFRRQNQEVKPYDNTRGFVTREWFYQFHGKDNANDALKTFDNMVKSIRDLLEKHENN